MSIENLTLNESERATEIPVNFRDVRSAWAFSGSRVSVLF